MSATHTSDLVIIGGGPAGLTGALYGARAMLKTVVLEALRAAVARLGRAVRTREVAQEIRRRAAVGLPTLQSEHQNAVRQRLMILARPRVRGAKAGQFAVRVPTPAKLGVRSAHWLPADHPAAGEAAAGAATTDPETRATARVAPRSRASAVCAAIRTSALLLGRPVARAEIRAMLEWGMLRDEAVLLLGAQAEGSGRPQVPGATEGAGAPTDQRAPAMSGRDRRSRHVDVLGPTLAFAASADAKAVAAGVDGRVRVITSAFTCRGGAPPRYSTAAPSPDAIAACLFADMAADFRVRDEVAGIAALRRRAEALESQLLHQIAWTREAVLSERLHAALASVPTRWRPDAGKLKRLGLRAPASAVEQVAVPVRKAASQLRAQLETAELTRGQRSGVRAIWQSA